MRNSFITSIGNVSVDISLRIVNPIERGKEVLASEFYLGGGGAASNLALAVARLGVKSRFLGYVGNDYYSSLVLKELKGEGVDISFVKVIEGRTGVVVILVEEGGERTMIAYRGVNEYVSEELITEESLRNTSILHVSSLPGNKALRILKKTKSISKNILCSYDPGSAITTEGVMDCLKYIDIFLPNLRELMELTKKASKEECIENLLSIAPHLRIGVKEGASGSSFYSLDSRCTSRAFKVHALDTTGAGDAFDAAFLVGLSIGLNPEEVLTFANATAALKVVRRGARGSPKLREVLNFLREKGYEELSEEISLRILGRSY